ncbi:FG-GAP-like repeat-containing protein [Embleya sp. AB8]|uniref:FG-GAP-like repeat-containing protein n=1 Tax=Embleya sp. AB8 TaxID=3156304 RepID=UPI003C7360CF
MDSCERPTLPKILTLGNFLNTSRVSSACSRSRGGQSFPGKEAFPDDARVFVVHALVRMTAPDSFTRESGRCRRAPISSHLRAARRRRFHGCGLPCAEAAGKGERLVSQLSGRFRWPSRRPRKRTSAAVAVATAAALGAGGLVVLTHDGSGGGDRTAAPTRVDENTAQRRARESGKPVTVQTTLSATGSTVANPDGSFTRTEHVLPVRVRVGTGWADVDTVLQPVPGGYAPKATTVKVVFAAGGTPATADAPTSGVPRPRPAPRRLPADKPTPASAGAEDPASPGAGARTTAASGASADPSSGGAGTSGAPSGPVQETLEWPGPMSPGAPPKGTATPVPDPLPSVRSNAELAAAQGPLPDGVLVRTTLESGKTFTVAWPNGALPKARITGDRALYPDVFPGVDLVLTARDGGFSQVLVVKNRDAAANPGVAELAYRLSAADLSFAHDAESGVTNVVDTAGNTVAASPTPFMWDSAGHTPGSLWDQRRGSLANAAASASRPAESSAPAASGTGTLALPGLEGPEPGTHEAVAVSSFDAGRLRIVPDGKLLTGTDTVFPVFVDPSFWGHSAAWTLVYAPYPNSSFWMGANFNGGTTNARVGHENQSGGTGRSYFRMSFDPSLRGANLQAATFRALEVHSWSCSARPVNLFLTGPIDSATTWNKQPGQSTLQQQVNVAKGYSANCPGDWVGFDVMDAATKARDGGWGDITLMLRADSETDTYGWKKFDVNPSLEVVYRRPPNPPSDISITPGGPCKTSAPYPVVGQTDVTINARGSDPDGDLRRIWLTVDSSTKPAGQHLQFGYLDVDGQGWIHYRIPTDQLDDKATVSFMMQANDWTGADSDPAAVVTCSFTVDKSRPNPPTVVSEQFKEGSDTAWPQGAKYGTPAAFTFASGGTADTVEYAYSFDRNSSDNRVRAPIRGQSATIDLVPPHAGPTQLYVQAIDQAGNRSAQTVYNFFVEPRDQIDGAMDFTGDQRPDLALVDADGNLRIHPSAPGGRLFQGIDATKTDDGTGAPGQPQVPAGYFKGALTTYNGDWWGGDGFQDLIARMPDGKLWVYPGNGRGAIDTAGRMELLLPTGAPDPRNLTQILSLGDATGDGLPDMLATTGDDLWAFSGYTGASTLTATKVSDSGWAKYTFHGAGDITGDGAYDLILREKTGDGKLLLRKGTKQGNGTDLRSFAASDDNTTTWGESGWQQSVFPQITVIPDVTGDGIPDVWAVQADGKRFLYPGGRTSHGTRTDLGGDAGDFCQAFPAAGGGTAKLCGPVLLKYLELGGTDTLGLPVGDSTATPTKPGTYAHFRKTGQSDTSIYWSADTGAHWIHGTIRNKWIQLTWENSYLGFPTTEEYPVAGGMRTDFQGGYIRWSQPTDTAADHTWSGETPATHITMAGDFNGDGKADLATVIDYGGGAAALWTSLATPTGSLAQPFESWRVPAGTWNIGAAKWVAGDFNGDGRDDIAALYNYGNGHVGLFTMTSRPDGGFNPDLGSWTQASGWDWDRTTLLAGDTNGDGKDELVAIYGFADARVANYTFTPRPDGGFNAPVKGFEETHPGYWDYQKAAYALGDVNGDKRADIIGTYIYGDGNVTVFTGLADTNGNHPGFNTAAWSATGLRWRRNDIQITAGDTNHDGRDDLRMMDANLGMVTTVRTFTSNADGTLNAPVEDFGVAPDRWINKTYVPHSGDVNGDGLSDILTLYNFGNGRFAAWTITTGTDGHATANVAWDKPLGTW